MATATTGDRSELQGRRHTQQGVSPFQLLYGINMRLPVETSLSKLLPAHTRSLQNAETLAKQLSLMRQEAQQTAQDSRQRTADAINKTKITPEFEIGTESLQGQGRSRRFGRP